METRTETLGSLPSEPPWGEFKYLVKVFVQNSGQLGRFLNKNINSKVYYIEHMGDMMNLCVFIYSVLNT